MKLVVYTALFADESLPLEEVGRFFPFTHERGDVKYIAFTNREDLKSDFWDVKVLKKDKDKSFLQKTKGSYPGWLRRLSGSHVASSGQMTRMTTITIINPTIGIAVRAI